MGVDYYPRFARQTLTSRCGAFKRLGTDVAQMAMATDAVVDDFDVVEDVGPGQLPGFADALAHAFFLQAAEEGLGNGIVSCRAGSCWAADCACGKSA